MANSINSVSDFISTTNASGTSRTDNQSLSMDDFLQLMVAQLQNQDMFSPADNSQMINQMAQFSMVNALTNMQTLTSTAYSMSLIGKQAVIAYTDSNGQMQSVTGRVDGVNLFNGAAEVVVEGNAYALSNVMSVADAASGSANNSDLVASADLIGMNATAMRGTDEGIETVRGKIEQLRLVDGAVRAYIGGKAYYLYELTELSETEEAEAAGETSTP